MIQILSHYGYAGVWLGIFLESAGVPVPGEAILIAATFSAAHHVLSLEGVIGVAVLAAITGDSLGFALGRFAGRPWMERHGRWFLLTPERLARVDRFFDRFGPPSVALARFVTGIRVVAAFSAGMSRMRWSVFFRWNLLGALAWATVVGFGGFALGSGWRSLRSSAGMEGAISLVVVPAGLLSLYAFWRLRGSGRSIRIRRFGAPVWIWGGAFSLAALGIFARVAEDVVKAETGPIDGAVRDWVLDHQEASLDFLSRSLTWLGSPYVLGPLALAVSALLLFRRGPASAAATALVPLVTGSLIFGLKTLFDRAASTGGFGEVFLRTSFPSGRSAAVTAVLISVSYVVAREGKGGLWLMGTSLGLAVLVGGGLIYVSANWATDVLGGWMVGLYLAALTAAVYEGTLRRDVSSAGEVPLQEP